MWRNVKEVHFLSRKRFRAELIGHFTLAAHASRVERFHSIYFRCWLILARAGVVRDVASTDTLPEHVAPVAGAGAAAASEAARGAKKDKDGGYQLFISNPFNVKHNIHVQVDSSAPTGFKGLPPQWDAMLSVSGITKEQVASHPQEVLDVLQFHMEGPPPKLPKKAVFGELRG